MKVEEFVAALGADFYTGVPDSLLQPMCNYLMDVYGTDPRHHVIAANEGNCVGLAAGAYLATGRIPVVYMQNSGEGNAVNPIASLLHKEVYGIPVIFVIGWRGEPGVHDEPQHVYQGRITDKLLALLEIPVFVLDRETAAGEVRDAMRGFKDALADGRSVAFIVKKGALAFEKRLVYKNGYTMRREDIIRRLLDVCGDDPVVSTTGKASRELFELREASGKGHGRDFLTVGSMGHSSSIALGIALQRPEKTVWCIDGDGAVLMHMGALAVIGASAPENLRHVVINNEAHESVGGLPTAIGKIRLTRLAEACGYRYAALAETEETLREELCGFRDRKGPAFLEIRAAIGAREELGRPTTTPKENKEDFTAFLRR